MREKIRELIRQVYEKINYYNNEINKTENPVVISNLIAAKNELKIVALSLEDILKPKAKNNR